MLGKNYLLFVLALLSMNLGSTNAFAGILGDGKGGPGGGKGGEGSFEFSGLWCGTEQTYAPVQLLCDFLSAYIQGQLEGGGDSSTESSGADGVDTGARKLRGGTN